MRGEWRSEPTWPAERLRPTVWRPDGDERDRIVGAWRRRDGCLDLVRGEASVDAPGRPARGRRALADVRLAARGGARAPRAPTASAHDHVAAPGGIPLRAALRRLPRRRIGPREPRRPESHPPREPLRSRSRSKRVFRRRSTSSSRRRPGSSRRAIACGSRSRARTGRTPGRLLTEARSGSRGTRSSSSSPCSTAHLSRHRPSSLRRHRRPSSTSRTSSSRRPCA